MVSTVAFLLQSREPQEVPEPVRTWIAPDHPMPVIGLNVSGLIYNDPTMARERYGLKADYRETVKTLVSRLLARTGSRIVLIAHVLAPPGHYESDVQAAGAVRASLSLGDQARVAVLPVSYDQSELKWIIGRLDWFCGTRMHATIAALSSGVPTAAIAYSGKTVGVFATCGQEAEVTDPRSLDTDEVVDGVWRSWERRDEARRSLADGLLGVFQTANAQMDLIAAECTSAAEHGAKTRT
jgi:polysaccharide pyruvyl transferase WcaK-like protein